MVRPTCVWLSYFDGDLRTLSVGILNVLGDQSVTYLTVTQASLGIGIVSHFEVDDMAYKIRSRPDAELFIDNHAFSDALPIGSYVD